MSATASPTGSTVLSTGKAGTLCAGGFEHGNGTYWEVRRVNRTAYIVYRTSIAVTEIGRYDNPADAYAEYHQHVPPRSPDLEASMGG
jgi:hypothetical protein